MGVGKKYFLSQGHRRHLCHTFASLMINFSEVEGPTIKVQRLHETRSKFEIQKVVFKTIVEQSSNNMQTTIKLLCTVDTVSLSPSPQYVTFFLYVQKYAVKSSTQKLTMYCKSY